MKFRFLPMMVLAAIPFLGNAQRNCGTMENHQQLLQQDPAMQSRMNQIEAQARDYDRQHRHDKVTGIVYTIPVVVHVVYNGTTQNISDAQVLSHRRHLELRGQQLRSWHNRDKIFSFLKPKKPRRRLLVKYLWGVGFARIKRIL